MISICYIKRGREKMAHLTIDRLIDLCKVPHEVVVWDAAKQGDVMKGVAVNHILSQAKGDVVCYFDNDIWMPENWPAVAEAWAKRDDIPNWWGFTWKMRDWPRKDRYQGWLEDDPAFLEAKMKSDEHWIDWPGTGKMSGSLQWEGGHMYWDISPRHKSTQVIMTHHPHNLEPLLDPARKYHQDAHFSTSLFQKGYAVGIWESNIPPMHLGAYREEDVK